MSPCARGGRCAPTVVQVTTSNVRQGIFTLDLDEIPRGTGSGFVWDLDGHIVTNYHVITGAQRAKIGLKDGRSYDATLVGAYPDSDIAVLKVSREGRDGWRKGWGTDGARVYDCFIADAAN